ncbi:MAG: hypothetical protein ACOH16_01415 [Propionibacteriaceae bacterium]
MTLIVLASASGSPGGTTTSLGLAQVWHRPVVLVDADPVGGSALLAGYFQGTVVDDDAMVTLVMAHRDCRLAEELPRTLLTIPETTIAILPGPKSHAQAGSLTDLWPGLAIELRALEQNGQDVIVDVGRLGMVHSATALIAAADLALLVTRSSLPALAAARQWAADLAAGSGDGTGAAAVATLLVGPGRPYAASEVSRVLSAPVLETIAWDPQAARVLSEGEKPASTRWNRRDDLVRSYRATAAAITTRIAADRVAMASGRAR